MVQQCTRHEVTDWQTINAVVLYNGPTGSGGFASLPIQNGEELTFMFAPNTAQALNPGWEGVIQIANIEARSEPTDYSSGAAVQGGMAVTPNATLVEAGTQWARYSFAPSYQPAYLTVVTLTGYVRNPHTAFQEVCVEVPEPAPPALTEAAQTRLNVERRAPGYRLEWTRFETFPLQQQIYQLGQVAALSAPRPKMSGLHHILTKIRHEIELTDDPPASWHRTIYTFDKRPGQTIFGTPLFFAWDTPGAGWDQGQWRD